MLTANVMGHWIPVTWLTLGADFAVWGMNPFGYHLTNLLLHAASAASSISSRGACWGSRCRRPRPES